MTKQKRFFTYDFWDILIIFLGISFSGVGTYLLYSDKGENLSTSKSKKIGKISTLKGDIKVRTKGALRWKEAKALEKIYRDDIVFTGDGSSATIILDNGLEINLVKDSMIRITDLNKKIELQIMKGDIDLNFKSKRPDDIIISSGEEKLKLTAEKGKVEVKKSNTGTTIKSVNANIVVKKGKKLQKIKAKEIISTTKPPPIVKKPKKIITKSLDLIKEPKDKSIYELILLENTGLKISIDNKYDKKGSLSLYKDGKRIKSIKFPPSNLFLKVYKKGNYQLRYEYKKDNIITKSSSSFIINKKDEKLKLRYKISGNSIQFFWDKLLINDYQLVYKDLKKEVRYLSNNQYTFTPLTFNSVKAQVFSKDRKIKSNIVNIDLNYDLNTLFPKTFNQKKLNISSRVTKIKTHPLFINDSHRVTIFDKSNNEFTVTNKGLSLLTAKRGPGRISIYKDQTLLKDFKIILQGNVAKKSTMYKQEQMKETSPPSIEIIFVKLNQENCCILSLSKDKHFTKIIKNEKVKSRKLNLPLKNFGRYYWKVSPIDSNNFDFESDIYPLDISQSKFEYTPPLKYQKRLFIEDKTSRNNFLVRLNKKHPIKNIEKFHLQIFEDKEGQNKVLDKKSQSNTFSWQTSNSGMYYFKYRVKPRNRRWSKFSKMGILVFPVSPFLSPQIFKAIIKERKEKK